MSTVTHAVVDLAPSPAQSETQLIGSSRRLAQVLHSIRMVARTDTTVLIEGETGTGKELVARAIHQQSLRSSGPCVKVNCAAMPSGLFESELFGHERGAFTGAVIQTAGRFQMAHKGTLFLDEIGDLPLEQQPKLLRAVQEQEFERVGGTRTVRVDVRVVAATNQGLKRMVEERRFRADLYYRLNVFPIVLPALRDRTDDIPLLIRHFVRTFAARLNKDITRVPDEVMELLQLHDWPGNIRELQNFIERAAIMSSGPDLRLPPGELERLGRKNVAVSSQTLADVQRDHIIHVLRQARGIVGGRDGAAARLGLPRTTLLYRMQKLGIAPSGFTVAMPPATPA